MRVIQKSIILSVIMAFLIGMSALGEAQEKIAITMTGGAVGQELDLIKEGVRLYMETHPNIEITIKELPDSSTIRLLQFRKFLRDQDPEIDVYQVDVIWPGDLAKHFVDLNDYGASAMTAEHFPALIQNNTVEGRLVAMPWFTDAGLLYYRTDLLRKYGYAAPPATWDELEEIAKAIQDGEVLAGNENFWGFIWQGNKYEGLTCNALEWIASSGGETFIDPDKQVTINNPQALAALERASRWVGTISPYMVLEFMEAESHRWWLAGNAAFMRNWPYAYALSNAPDSPVRGKFDVAPLPGEQPGQSAAALGGWQLAVSRYSRHPKEAAEFVLFMTSKAEQKRRAIAGSYNPTIPSLYEDEEVLNAAPFMGKLYDVFVNAVARPSAATSPKYGEATDDIFTTIHDVLSGKQDAASAIESLELDLEELVASE